MPARIARTDPVIHHSPTRGGDLLAGSLESRSVGRNEEIGRLRGGRDAGAVVSPRRERRPATVLGRRAHARVARTRLGLSRHERNAPAGSRSAPAPAATSCCGARHGSALLRAPPADVGAAPHDLIVREAFARCGALVARLCAQLREPAVKGEPRVMAMAIAPHAAPQSSSAVIWVRAAWSPPRSRQWPTLSSHVVKHSRTVDSPVDIPWVDCWVMAVPPCSCGARRMGVRISATEARRDSPA